MRRWQHELQPGKRDILDRKSEKRASFWEWLGHTAAEGSNEAPNSSKRKHLAKDHTRWRHLPTEDGHFPVPEIGDRHSKKDILRRQTRSSCQSSGVA